MGVGDGRSAEGEGGTKLQGEDVGLKPLIEGHNWSICFMSNT